MPNKVASWNRHAILYGFLILLRVVFAFFGTGYIHPDEYFQNGEVTAGSLLGLHTLRTWEWDAEFPCRSIVPPFMTTGVPFLLLKALFKEQSIPPVYIFAVERLSFLSSSFFLDYSVYQLLPHSKSLGLLLLASSHVVMTFQLRPFSNSAEAFLLVSSLRAMQKLLYSAGQRNGRTQRTSYTRGPTVVALLFVDGVFTRLTFAGFASPIIITVLLWSLQQAKEEDHFSMSRWKHLITRPLIMAALSVAGYGIVDTMYFREDDRLVLTPYNFLLYNLSSENLAQHGLHPRWLHLVVNLPMIISPGLVYYGILAGWRVICNSPKKKAKTGSSPFEVILKTCFYIIATSMVLLSVQPHQEPRFLTPLVVPVVVLVVGSGYVQRAGKVFWLTWIIFNIVLSLLFGVLHQGGVVPSLLRLHGLINGESSSNGSAIVYWRTYMPPRHLLGIPEHDVVSGRVRVTDLAGAPPDQVENTLVSLISHRKNTTLYIVTPPFAMQALQSPLSACFAVEKHLFPHLDMDHIPESLEVGWPEGLTLGIYVADSDCIEGHAFSIAH